MPEAITQLPLYINALEMPGFLFADSYALSPE
jgi:hypothetical protein